MDLLDFNEVTAGMKQFSDQPDIMAAWKAYNYILLEALLKCFAKAATFPLTEFASALQQDDGEAFHALMQKGSLALAIAESVADWHKNTPMLGCDNR